MTKHAFIKINYIQLHLACVWSIMQTKEIYRFYFLWKKSIYPKAPTSYLQILQSKQNHFKKHLTVLKEIK